MKHTTPLPNSLWRSLQAHYAMLDPEEKKQAEDLATARAVHDHRVTRDGVPYTGIALDCLRNPEHGVGVLLHGTRVVAVGTADLAARTDLAERDARDSRTGLDESLLGHWSTVPFDYGVMECSDFELRADGTGWASVTNAFMEDAQLLTWHCPEPGVLEVRSPPEIGEARRHRYRVGPEVPVDSTEPVMSITFDPAFVYGPQYAKST
ncbi:hypothetical protein QNN03_32030 [Streptomyces sp. GXMU-J15]|uniref:DUF6985 domain-containing protein n=1 Tax=Streptomyces fuscus TaxID=3048495 RepID=A0ABT7J882_9ACTN|nr:hypothetical protein [Streptomyces fuscus]MDL2081083.1 hypothetical protein [Streptomyces fuscus]